MKAPVLILKEFGVTRFLQVALRESIRRVWSNETQHVYSFDLTQALGRDDSIPPISVHPATYAEIVEFLHPHRADSYPDARTKIEIFLFANAQIPTPYIGMANGVPAVICWMITAEHNGALQQHFRGGVFELGSADVLLEFIYTQPSFRGSSYMHSLTRELFQIARSNGKGRAIAFVNSMNTNSVRGSAKIGWQPFQRKTVKRRFFTRAIRFAPPTIPGAEV